MRKIVNISMDSKIYEKAKKAAENLGISMSAFISTLIANYKEKV